MKRIYLVKSSQNHGDLCRRIRMTCIIFFSVNWKREREGKFYGQWAKHAWMTNQWQRIWSSQVKISKRPKPLNLFETYEITNWTNGYTIKIRNKPWPLVGQEIHNQEFGPCSRYTYLLMERRQRNKKVYQLVRPQNP